MKIISKEKGKKKERETRINSKKLVERREKEGERERDARINKNKSAEKGERRGEPLE